jgi:hypothetical protein
MLVWIRASSSLIEPELSITQMMSTGRLTSVAVAEELAQAGAGRSS